MAWEIINLQREANRQLGEFPLRLAHFFHILIELIQAHPPVVEIIPRHRRMIGEADLAQPGLECARGQLPRLARRVPAKRRMHVIVSGPSHVAMWPRGRRKPSAQYSVFSIQYSVHQYSVTED